MDRSTSARPAGRRWPNTPTWLTVEWLPKYTPELNDIEIVWGDLKARHLAHRTFIDLDSLDSAIHHAVTDLNSTRNRDPLDSQQISA